jgi:hypothetical protein
MENDDSFKMTIDTLNKAMELINPFPADKAVAIALSPKDYEALKRTLSKDKYTGLLHTGLRVYVWPRLSSGAARLYKNWEAFDRDRKRYDPICYFFEFDVFGTNYTYKEQEDWVHSSLNPFSHVIKISLDEKSIILVDPTQDKIEKVRLILVERTVNPRTRLTVACAMDQLSSFKGFDF